MFYVIKLLVLIGASATLIGIGLGSYISYKERGCERTKNYYKYREEDFEDHEG